MAASQLHKKLGNCVSGNERGGNARDANAKHTTVSMGGRFFRRRMFTLPLFVIAGLDPAIH
jgi:hypothetical protein